MTNVHAHVFTMDHVPPIQLFYMVKDIINSVLTRIPVRVPIARIEQKRRMPVLSICAVCVSPFFRRSMSSMLSFFSAVSDITVADLRDDTQLRHLFDRAGRMTLRLLVRFIRRQMRDGATFDLVVVNLVTALYRINNGKPNKTRDQASVLARLLRSIRKLHPYERIVLLSMDFDTAFAHVYNPGFVPTDVTGDDYRVPHIGFADDSRDSGHLSQTRELIQVTKDAAAIAGGAGYPNGIKVIPFFCVDPRGYDDASAARQALKAARKSGFCGVKIYPPLGYLPEDPRLTKVFNYCLKKDMPVMSHCGRGGAGRKGPVNFSDLAHPYNWIPVLDRLCAKWEGKKLPFGKFRLCLAHFDSLRYRDEVAWWDEIIRLIKKYHDNPVVKVYVDVSANFPRRSRTAKRYFRRLKYRGFLNPKVAPSLLFGSDWWMQLHSVSEPEYFKTYFERYQHRAYYPGADQRKGSEPLKALFERNAEKYLGTWY